MGLFSLFYLILFLTIWRQEILSYLILSYLILLFGGKSENKKTAAEDTLIHYTCPPVLAGRRPPVWRTWVVRHRRGAAEQVSSVCRSRRHLRLRLPCLTSPPAGHLLGLAPVAFMPVGFLYQRPGTGHK